MKLDCNLLLLLVLTSSLLAKWSAIAFVQLYTLSYPILMIPLLGFLIFLLLDYPQTIQLSTTILHCSINPHYISRIIILNKYSLIIFDRKELWANKCFVK